MTWAHAGRSTVLALSVLLAVASAVPMSRLRFDADVLHLMPRDTGAVGAFETYLSTFGSLDALYVYIEAPSDGAVADYAEFVEALGAALARLPEVTRVDTGLRDDSRDWSYVADRQLLLLDQDGYTTAVARLAPPAIPGQVRRTRDLLSLPSAEVKALAQRDPLGWFELSGARLQGAAGLLRINPGSTDGYVTMVGRSYWSCIRRSRHSTRPSHECSSTT